MRFALIVLIILHFGAGILVIVGAKSAIHEILGATNIGFGSVIFALLAVYNVLNRDRPTA